MSISPNIRTPCGGAKPAKFLHGCNQQHFINEQNAIKIKYNTTKLLNYAAPGDDVPAYIDPVPIANQATAPDCSPYDGAVYDCGQLDDPDAPGYGNLWCWPIPDSYFVSQPNGGTQFNVGVGYHNYYTQSSDTQSITTCRDLGFKNVYGKKEWQGRFAYTSRMNQQADWFDWCCGCTYHNADETADQTKYRSVACSVDLAQHTDYYCCAATCNCDAPCDTCGPCGTPLGECGTFLCDGDEVCDACISCTANGDNDWSATAFASDTVDIYGNHTSTCSSGSSCPGSFPTCCDGPVTPDPEDIALCEKYWAEAAFMKTAEADFLPDFLIDTWCGYIAAFAQCMGCGPPDVITGDGTAWHVEFHQTYDCFDECGNVTSTNSYSTLEMDITVGSSLHIQQFGLKPNGFNGTHCVSDGFCPSVQKVYDEVITFGALSYNRSLFANGIGSWSFNDVYTEDVEGSLATPYTAQQVYDDLVTLLGTWDFGDNNVYPWRTDGNVTIGPLVSRDEVGGGPQINLCSSSNAMSGRIVGSPGPEGIDRIWDAKHKNYCVCDSLVQPGCLIFYTRDYGAWSTDIGVPRATQWLDTFIANQIPQGAFCGTNYFCTFPSTCNSSGPSCGPSAALWACKYAETIFPKQSYNFFRPCGLDRYQITESFANCITEVTDGTLTLEPAGPSSIVNTGDYAWVCGTTDWDGCWKVSSGGGYSVTLQEPRIVSASQLPIQPIADCGTGMIGKLRWQNLQPAICGRLSILDATPTMPITITLEEPTYLGNTDHIYIVGATGGMPLNGYWEVQPVDASTMILLGSDGTTGSYVNGSGQAYSPFAPDWKWNDDSGKGEFSVVKWLFNYRDVGEYFRTSGSVVWNEQLLRCDGITPCPGPAVPSEPRPYQQPCGMDQNLESNTCDTECLPFSSCAPSVAYFSPNVGSESFNKSGTAITTAKNYGFEFPGIDPQYGSMWQAAIKQTMDDPLFSPPPCPCQAVFNEDTEETTYECDCGFRMDDGSCQSDQEGEDVPCIKYYPHVNQYEARCKPPDGAPVLPAGVYIGCLNSTAFISPTCPQGNICSAPYAPHDFKFEETCDPYWVYPWATPWILLLTEEGCICADGRFANYYEANGVKCQDGFDPP